MRDDEESAGVSDDFRDGRSAQEPRDPRAGGRSPGAMTPSQMLSALQGAAAPVRSGRGAGGVSASENSPGDAGQVDPVQEGGAPEVRSTRSARPVRPDAGRSRSKPGRSGPAQDQPAGSQDRGAQDRGAQDRDLRTSGAQPTGPLAARAGFGALAVHDEDDLASGPGTSLPGNDMAAAVDRESDRADRQRHARSRMPTGRATPSQQRESLARLGLMQLALPLARALIRSERGARSPAAGDSRESKAPAGGRGRQHSEETESAPSELSQLVRLIDVSVCLSGSFAEAAGLSEEALEQQPELRRRTAAIAAEIVAESWEANGDEPSAAAMSAIARAFGKAADKWEVASWPMLASPGASPAAGPAASPAAGSTRALAGPAAERATGMATGQGDIETNHRLALMRSFSRVSRLTARHAFYHPDREVLTGELMERTLETATAVAAKLAPQDADLDAKVALYDETLSTVADLLVECYTAQLRKLARSGRQPADSGAEARIAFCDAQMSQVWRDVAFRCGALAGIVSRVRIDDVIEDMLDPGVRS